VKVSGETQFVPFQIVLKKLNVEHPVFPAHLFELPEHVHFKLVQDTAELPELKEPLVTWI